LEDDGDLAGRVRGQVSQALSEGVPRISDVAGQLGMSGRTLQRKLADQGYSYQSLVDEARRHLAGQLLRETDYALVEVAFMTGFSEQSAFSRAFKRWEGQTPRSYRLNAS
ncbi:MAG TPA: helix-turn-helix transcriptional regulator, partial [Calditrichia bacterium]|nr:helix-turn-helix transcriptional regulator [Calditrichia bacterium]